DGVRVRHDADGPVAVLAPLPAPAEVAGGRDLDGEALERPRLNAVLPALVVPAHDAVTPVHRVDGVDEVGPVGPDHAHAYVEAGPRDLPREHDFLVPGLLLVGLDEGRLRAHVPQGYEQAGPQDHDD